MFTDCHQVPQSGRMSKVRGRGQVNEAEMCHPGQPKEHIPLAHRTGGAGRSRRSGTISPGKFYRLTSTSSRGSPMHFCFVKHCSLLQIHSFKQMYYFILYLPGNTIISLLCFSIKYTQVANESVIQRWMANK